MTQLYKNRTILKNKESPQNYPLSNKSPSQPLANRCIIFSELFLLVNVEANKNPPNFQDYRGHIGSSSRLLVFLVCMYHLVATADLIDFVGFLCAGRLVLNVMQIHRSLGLVSCRI
ncbi:hypothetical protein XELAEV_18029353mg [Xenopus laevis]|uniref:Uncharacterized protein n=1 Tax=Xenopus laevis TaxID=8355 RepID=A0A974HHL1_XENLA|nr:hypothetical protein XELAEV_18029353mg [Xenopus laevis]